MIKKKNFKKKYIYIDEKKKNGGKNPLSMATESIKTEGGKNSLTFPFLYI